METRDDQVIYLKDIFFSVLYQWRKVICAIIAFAILMGGIQAVKLVSGHAATQEAYEKELKAYEASVQGCKENIDAIIQNIETQKTYLYNSVRMKINPYRVCVGSLILNIKVNSQDAPSKVVTLLEVYSRMLGEAEALAAASEALQVDIEYLRELVSIKYVSDGTLLIVTVLGDTEDMADQLMITLKDYITSNYQQVKAGIGYHELVEVSRGVSHKTMLDLVGEKDNAENYLKTLEDGLKAAEREKNSLVHPWNNVLTKKTASIKILRDAIIGGFIGGLLMAVFAVVQHIFRKRIYSARTLKNRTGLKVLGCVPAGKKKRALDRLLRKLDGRTMKENVPFLQANMQNYYAGAKKILVTGIETDQGERIAEYLTQAGMPGVYCGNMMEDADTLTALASCDAVLVVAECNRTAYASINQSCEMIYQDATIGCVLING